MKRWALALVVGVVGVAACTSDDGSPSALPSTESEVMRWPIEVGDPGRSVDQHGTTPTIARAV